MATGPATGGRVILFMPPTPPGSPVTPTVLTGAPATAGTGKRSLSTKILAALYITAKTLIKTIFLYCNPQANDEYVLLYEAVPANHRGFKSTDGQQNASTTLLIEVGYFFLKGRTN